MSEAWSKASMSKSTIWEGELLARTTTTNLKSFFEIALSTSRKRPASDHFAVFPSG